MTSSPHIKSPTPDFAFVVPVGPGPHPWLRHSLRSLAAQSSIVAVAICAVEDSPDLQDVLTEFSDIIRYIRIGPDGGQSDAINEGWSAIHARYYGWLNDDDILHPDATSRAMHAFTQTDADVVHGHTHILDHETIRFGYGGDAVGPALMRDNILAQPSTFIARAALLAVDLDTPGTLTIPVDPDRHFTMDWDLWQRLYLSGAKFQAIPDTLSITRWYDGTKTAAPGLRKYKEYFSLMKRGGFGPRAVWAMINIALHNGATYGRARAQFSTIKSGLLRVKTQTATVTTAPTLDVFHYEDHPVFLMTPNEPVLAPGESRQLALDAISFGAPPL
ncbi:hypothetical protein GCM10009069_05770 [Algimonas arctica]|uniref:Glycosyltransferase 2-like domain-containing protein n=1 Tax=Algimonas arctica TaxID=1479486 RepID=A0A8J3CQ50_9PROT|nr:glycosyltransferase [Algimonas arctica]GHA85461.1 hypothetical protein GCM10009069_05770 [Algimonas arctica]